MPNMIATKSLSYATRRLLPGDHFVTKTDRDARILLAIGKAKLARVPGHIAPPPESVVAKVVPSPRDVVPQKFGVYPTPDGIPVPIPDDWEDMHHTKIVSLARDLIGSDFEPRAGQTKTGRARAIITATVENRSNPPAKPDEA